MDTLERDSYRAFGELMIGVTIVAWPISMLCVGILTPLYGLVIYTLTKRKEKSLHAKAMLTIISFSLLTSIGYFAIQIVFQITIVSCIYPSLSLCTSDPVPIAEFVSVTISTLPLIFNDGVIIWRAWCVLGKQRWASVLSIGLCMLSFLVALTYIGLLGAFEGFDWNTRPPILAPLSSLDYAFFGVSLVTNAVATSFIWWTLWQHLKFIRDNEISKQKLFGAWRILVLLLDSGVIYFFLQSAMLGLQFSKISKNATSYVYSAFACLYRNISFSYPSLTILLVQEVSSVEEFHNSVVALQTSKDDVAQLL